MHVSLIGALILAAVTTAGDYAWFEFGIRHTWQAGVLHGILMMGTLGAVLGGRAGRIGLGILGGIVAGVAGAGMFYAMAPMLRWNAMFVAWSAVWIALAIYDQRVILKQPGSGWLPRGLAAAILGGAAFYMISGVWTAHGDNPNYAWHFLAWFIAWWPGLAALTMGRRR